MGFFGDIWGGLTGGNARKDLDKGIGAVNANTGKAESAIRQGGEQALGFQDPYRQQGGRAFGMYGDTLGVNGLDARDAAQGVYLSDPILARQRELDAKRQGWAFNSRGGYGAGAHALASNRAMLENYGNWQGQLNQLGQQGQNAANMSSNIAQNTGQGVAGVYGQNSAALANLYGQRAQSQNALAQNIIGIGGVASRFMPWSWGNNLGRRSGGDGFGNP